MLRVTNDEGHPFNVRVVRLGEAYGVDDILTHDKIDPMIEFYDAEYENTHGFGERGQFVSRYNLATLQEFPEGRGLNLHGGVPGWVVSALNVRAAVEYAMEA